MISDWGEFKADTEKLFIKCLEDFMRENSEMVKTINYTCVGPFIPYLRRTLPNVLSYIGCTNVLSYLFYCNRLEDNICNFFQEQEILINFFIDYGRVNRYKNDSKEDTNFADSNPFGANHPILIFNHMLTVGSRIAMNILHKNLFPVSQWRTAVLIKEIGVFIVHIIKIICKQYYKYFWYGGIIELYDNIFDIDINNSILVLSKKETKKNEQ